MGQPTGSKSDAAREKVLDCAERLFMERGFAAVKLRDIADELGVRTASLYYYFPGGKHEMFLAVLDGAMDRYRVGLESAISGSPDDLASELEAAARFFLSQPKLDFFRMLESDLDQVDPKERGAVAMKMHRSLQGPIMESFARAIAHLDGRSVPMPELLAGSFLAIVQGIHHLRPDFEVPVAKDVMASQMCRLLAAGLSATPAASPDPLNGVGSPDER